MTPAAIAERLRGLNERARRLESSPDARANPVERGRPLVLCGAGPLCQLTLAHLRQIDAEPLAVVDNDPRRWGTLLDGIGITSPAEAVRLYAHTACFVVTIYNGRAVRRQMRTLGCTHVAHFAELFFRDPQEFLPFCGLAPRRVMLDAWEEAAAAAMLWCDGRSADEYLAQLEWRLRLGEAREMPAHDAAADIYFPPALYRFLDDEVLLDCGAFDGDSIRQYLHRRPGGGAQIVAFEPDPLTFARLEEYRRGLAPPIGARIRLEPSAVADRTGTVRFAALGSVRSGVEAGGVTTAAVALDDLALPGTLVKMDVEGFELPALRGAARLLRDRRPVLAISVYHHASDLWTIPNFLKRLVPDYRLFLRRYAEDCWESVLYAVPDSRLIHPGDS